MNVTFTNRNESETGLKAQKETNLTPIAAGARRLYQWLAWSLIGCILMQVFLAGLALFWDSASWSRHTGFARILFFIPVLMLVSSFVGRLPVSMRFRSAGLIGMIIMMAVSANLSAEFGYLAALHPVIAILLFRETSTLARTIRVKGE